MSPYISQETTKRVRSLYAAMRDLRTQTPDRELRVIGLESADGAMAPEFDGLYDYLAHTLLEDL
jgi:hypothetical protein